MFQVIKKSISLGSSTLTLETGRIARQASSVLCSMGETVVLVTVVASKEAKDVDFLPLSVDFITKFYAVGKVPGGYFRREGKPPESDVLTSRLIDRPIRPLFPEGYNHEIQIVAMVVSCDPEVNPDIPALIGASAALSISGLPFQGPLAASRVGYVKGQYVLNPTATQMKDSQLDLVMAGTEGAPMMVESEAKELPEATMLGALEFGLESFKPVLSLIKEFAAAVNKPAQEWIPQRADESLVNHIAQWARSELQLAYQIPEKTKRLNEVAHIRERVMGQCLEHFSSADPSALLKQAKTVFSDLEYRIMRDAVLDSGIRIDGRDLKTVRPINIEVGVLPRVHGSALFTRGETQALVISTLGTGRDAQMIESLEGEVKERFMLHYNFPPYSVGEIGRMGATKRREVGHGRLARRALEAVVPSEQDFSYVLRVVSEVTESNGSSSMATVCGTSLSLMDAGVPIKAPVAGIAMGLIKEGNRYAVLTDILGDEDHLGDMDFKVAGTATGVTALQMDIKIPGITIEIMQVALEQAKAGRMHILGEMNRCLIGPRPEMSQHAPRIVTLKIPVDKIREVIGKGGATIRSITEETGAVIDISEDGVVSIAAVDGLAGEAALARVKAIVTDIEVGQVYEGPVQRLLEFGAIVSLVPGKDGLVHISQISNQRVENIGDFLKEGQVVKVRVIEIDRQGRIRLSMKEFENQ